jgi:hypothetical protein
MNQGQERFLGFILERVKVENREEAQELLVDNFKKQAEGNFSKDDIQQFIPKITALLKPDKVEEVLSVMKEFSGSFGK